MTLYLIIAWALGLVAIVIIWRYVSTLGEDIDTPVPLAAHRALADELARVTAERDLLRRQMAAMEE